MPAEPLPAHYMTPLNRREVDQTPVDFMLWDSVGHAEYDRIRRLVYPDTHVVVVCFGVDSREALDKVEQRWVPEVRTFLPHVPVVVLATKTDLRGGSDGEGCLDTVLREEGQRMADRVGAVGYYECLARRGEGVHEVVGQVLRTAFEARQRVRRRRRCVAV